MSTLTVTVGLPGSGKTTWAEAEAKRTGAALLGRDRLRVAMFGSYEGAKGKEELITLAQFAAVTALLDAGHDVVVDDTNMVREHCLFLVGLGANSDAEIQLQDFTDVPVETCIERDAARPNPVGEANIRRMWAAYLLERNEIS